MQRGAALKIQETKLNESDIQRMIMQVLRYKGIADQYAVKDGRNVEDEVVGENKLARGKRSAAVMGVGGLKMVLKKDELYYIGDAPTDITACREAGVTCLTAAWSDSVDIENLKKLNPDFIFNNISSLRTFFESFSTNFKSRHFYSTTLNKLFDAKAD